jgi:hypothetical protein
VGAEALNRARLRGAAGAAVRLAGRGTAGRWLSAAGGLVLFLSLLLTWSHQLSPAFERRYAGSAALAGVPATPDAWQLYSSVDVLLALLSAGVLASALWPGRGWRLMLGLGLGLLVAIAFTLHALAVPPTNGALLGDPRQHPVGYLVDRPRSGTGETVALLALAMALCGLGLSLSDDRRPRRAGP